MLSYNEQNWTDVLDSLGFEEHVNPNGGMIVYDDRRLPMWTYESEKDKENLYYFFAGMVYYRLRMGFRS